MNRLLPDQAELEKLGREMHDFAADLMPICRSLTGNGVRRSLEMIGEHLPGLKLHEVPSGTKVLDWEIPDEWNIAGARITGPDGRTIVDFADHNLHVMGYSEPVSATMPLEELQKHLYSLPNQPDAIPYVTSYYARRWGFCMRHSDRLALEPGDYRVEIDASLAKGNLTYGEWFIPGDSEEEVFISTYICHPSMANNELSGPVVSAMLGKLLARTRRRYSYRIVFIPETIGSIVYLSRNLDHLKKAVVAGFNVSCIGDDRTYSYLASRNGGTLSDRAALHALNHHTPEFVRYSFLDRGSDERQYCAPGIDLPICSIMRSKYGEYPEYHTSLDDLKLVTPSGLAGGLGALARAIDIIEANAIWRTKVLGEPQLGKRGLYPTLSTVGSAQQVRTMMNTIAYADGTRDLIELAETIGADALHCAEILTTLEAHDLVERVGDA